MKHPPASPSTALGREIRAALVMRGLTQDELARRVGLTPSTLSRTLTGRRPLGEDEARAIAAELDLAPDALLAADGGDERDAPVRAADPAQRRAELVFASLDHRALINDLLASQDRTQAWLARESGLNRSHICEVLSGKAALSPDQALWTALALGLPRGSPELDYFVDLVAYAGEPDPMTRARLLEGLLVRRLERPGGRRTLAEYRLLSNGLNLAVLELARAPGYRPDPAWLGPRLRPPAPPEEVARALDLLVELGLLDAEARRPTERLVVVGPTADDDRARASARWEAQLRLTREMFGRAADAVEKLGPDLRYLNAGTALVPESRMPALQQMFHRWQREWMALCQEAEPPPESTPTRRAAFRLQLQFFPLSEWLEDPPSGGSGSEAT